VEQPPQVDLRRQPNGPNVDTSDRHAAVCEGVPVLPPPDLTFKWYDGERDDAACSVLVAPVVAGYSTDLSGAAR
jgi:hypothetical protein